MDKNEDKRVITLTLGRLSYPLTIKPEQEATYRAAAKQINDKLQRYERSYPNLGNDRYTWVALLDFAVQVINLEREKDHTPYEDTVSRLSAEIDSLLSTP